MKTWPADGAADGSSIFAMEACCGLPDSRKERSIEAQIRDCGEQRCLGTRHGPTGAEGEKGEVLVGRVCKQKMKATDYVLPDGKAGLGAKY